MTAEQVERDRLQRALVTFFEENRHLGLKSVRQWAIASNLSASTINPVLNGKANKRLEDETYFKLAVAASAMLSRPVTVDELKGANSVPTSVRPDIAAIIRDLDYISEVDPDMKDQLLDMIRKTAELARKTRGRD